MITGIVRFTIVLCRRGHFAWRQGSRDGYPAVPANGRTRLSVTPLITFSVNRVTLALPDGNAVRTTSDAFVPKVGLPFRKVQAAGMSRDGLKQIHPGAPEVRDSPTAQSVKPLEILN